MTKQELIAAIAALTDEDKAEIAAAAKKEKPNTYDTASIIRIRFGQFPNKEMRQKCKDAGFAWCDPGKYWFAEMTDKAMKFVAENGFEEAK